MAHRNLLAHVPAFACLILAMAAAPRPAVAQPADETPLETTCAALMDPGQRAGLADRLVTVRGAVAATEPARCSVFLGEADGPRLDVSAIPPYQRPSFHVGEEVTVTAICRRGEEADGDRAVLAVRVRSDIVHHLPTGNEPRRFKVLVLNFDPVCPEHGGKRTTEVFGWNNPHETAQQYIDALRDSSNGWANYEIVEWVDLDQHAPYGSGFVYPPDQYIEDWRNRANVKFPEGQCDEGALMTDKAFAHNNPLTVAERVAKGEIDEVFLFGSPAGSAFNEAAMAGPSPFFINGESYTIPEAGRNFAIMGFNYERDVDCMLEDFCHRTECTMSHLYNPADFWFPTSPAAHPWDAFRMFEQRTPGESALGICHFAPSSEKDYDWGNPRPVVSTCDDWLYNWPNLQGESTRRTVTAEEWGGGRMDYHHIWWLNHLPNAPGTGPDGKLLNWWKYVCDPNGY